MIRITTTKIMLLAVAFTASAGAFAQNVWTGSQSNDWNEPANWSLNTIPGPQTNVQISYSESNHYPIIDGQAGSADCLNFTVDNDALVTLTGYGTLRIGGTISAQNTINAEGGTVELTGVAPQILPATAFFNNTLSGLSIYNTTSVTLQGNLNLTGILTLQTGVFNTGGGLTLKSNQTYTAQVAESAGTIVGNVTVERYIPARRAFRLLSSPTTGGTISSNWQEGAPATDPVGLGTDITGTGGAANGFDPSNSNNPSLFTHNNLTAAWEAVTNTNIPLTAGTPYRILVRGDRTIDQTSNAAAPTPTTLRSTGTLVTGDVVMSDLNPAAGGFSFVGNPYQSTVDMTQLLEDDAAVNVNNNYYYIWDPTVNTRGAYVTVNLTTNMNTHVDSEADKYLRPAQAFFVKTQLAGPASITFKESHKVIIDNATPNLYRTNNEGGSIAVMLYTDESLAANGTAADGLVVAFEEGWSNEVDGFDAVKPINQDENIAVVNNGQQLSFESRAMPVAGETLPLSATTYRSTNYTFKVTLNNIGDVSAWLQDTYTGQLTALQNNAETLYSFTVAEGDAQSLAADRFNIVFQETLSAGEVAVQKPALYPNPANGNGFNILLPAADTATVTLYNTLGQAVATQVAAAGNALTVTPQSPLNDGLYMVEVTMGTQVYTSKIIVKN